MEHKVDTHRIDKRSSKKDRNNGTYSAKHIRNQENILSYANSKRTETKETKSKCTKTKVKK